MPQIPTIDRFEIIGQGWNRRPGERAIFCDGAGGELFETDRDLELSHWRPNRTPAQYRAGTSTEICLRFLDNPLPGDWTVAVNNHVDVDGILSVYALLHSQHALAHQSAIAEASRMGDFWGWGEPPAQRVFMGLTELMRSGAEGTAVYAEAFRRIPRLIDGTDPDTPALERRLAPLRRGVQLVEEGQIVRWEISERLTHYVIPQTIAGDDDTRASYVPEFNEAISEKALLWPQARAKWDTERVCLVSTERQGGWFHDVWFPGYHWADAAGLWCAPGMNYHDGMASYDLDCPPLAAAFAELQSQETAPGAWALGGTPSPLGEALQSRFPLVGRFCNEHGDSLISHTSPERAAEYLQPAFD
jgi:hypothetical protein